MTLRNWLAQLYQNNLRLDHKAKHRLKLSRKSFAKNKRSQARLTNLETAKISQKKKARATGHRPRSHLNKATEAERARGEIPPRLMIDLQAVDRWIPFLKEEKESKKTPLNGVLSKDPLRGHCTIFILSFQLSSVAQRLAARIC
ncbi:hypothetical protein ElyMa_002877400, partial [Elysia marginata]